MRMIGHVESEPLAQTFSDYLYVQGIKNQVEAEGDLPAKATADVFPAYDDDGGLLLVLTPKR